MSQENVDLVRRQIGEVDLAEVIRDDRRWAARRAEIEAGFHEDFEFVVKGPGEPVRGRGFADFRAQFLDWIEAWETYRPNIEEVIDLDDRVVVLGTDRGRMKGMDRDIDGPKGLVLYRFVGERVSRIEYYFDRDAGFKAAGLSE